MKAYHRLKGKKSFDQVFKNSHCRAKSHAFTILATHNALAYNRIGFILPKKQIKFACQRNKIKRLSREYFRHSLSDDLGIDLVLLSRPSIKQLLTTNTGPDQQLMKIWKRLSEHTWIVNAKQLKQLNLKNHRDIQPAV